MSECEQIEPMLERWLDGQSSEADGARVRDHLGACERCARALRRLERVDAALHGLLVSAVPPIAFKPFWRGIEVRLRERAPWHQELAERAKTWLAAPRAAWAIPALIAILIGVLSYDFKIPLGRSRSNLATVDSIDSHGRSVALLREDDSKTTVIWLYQTPEGDDEVADETPQPGPAF